MSWPAHAQSTAAKLAAIEQQIVALQAELQHVKHQLAIKTRQEQRGEGRMVAVGALVPPAPPVALVPQIPPGYALVPTAPGRAPGSVTLAKLEPATPPAPKLPLGAFQLGAVTVRLGGFIEAAAIYRSRNEVADIGSSYGTGIPLPNSPLYHESEFRGSSRQSRVSLLAEADPDDVTHITGYGEMDFVGAAPTANSNESNSYTPRMRVAYAQYDRSDWGFHFLAGQEWSLLTMNKVGITPRGEDIPLTIDAQYVAGFTWARQWQARFTEDFLDHRLWIAASIENPQTVYYTGPNGLAPASTGTININNPGGSTFASTTNYSNDIAPDVIVKAATDPGYGHFEAYGLGRVMHDRVILDSQGSGKTTLAGGAGAGMILPILPKTLDVQGSFLAGDGIGRYGSAQLPDAIVGANGAPKPLPEVEAMVGLIAHPDPAFDLYSYFGTEQIHRKYFADAGKGYGYGNPLYANSSCDVELGSSTDCIGNTSGVWQISAGAWWRFLHGPYGTVATGAQYSFTHRTIFQGVGPTPSTNENIVMLSFRYYPFQ